MRVYQPMHNLVYAIRSCKQVIADSGNHCIRIISLSHKDHSVATLAGSGTSGAQDGIGTSASFNRPTGIALDPAGTLLVVADSGNHRLRVLDLSNGAVSTLAGSVEGFADGAASEALFSNPLSVAAVRDTSMFANFLLVVADAGNGKLRAVDFRRRAVATLPLSEQELAHPTSVAASPNGRQLAVLNNASQLLLLNVDAAARTAAVTENPLEWQLHNGSISETRHAPKIAGGLTVSGNGEDLTLFVADSRHTIRQFRSMADGSKLVEPTCPLCGCTDYRNCSCGSIPDGTGCRECPRGSYCDCFSACFNSGGVPKPCPEGTYNDRLGASSQDACKVCPSGHICAAETEEPVPCPAAHYCPAATLRDCTVDAFPCQIQCPPGTQGNSTGHSDEKGACTECGQGHYGASSGALTCTPCPRGTYSSQRGSTACADCPAGYFCGEQSKAPQPCPINTYSSQVGAQDSSTCTPCDQGVFTEKDASPSREFCNRTVETSRPVTTTTATSTSPSTAPVVETPAPVEVVAQPMNVYIVQAQADLGGIAGQDEFLSCCAQAFLGILRDMVEPHVAGIQIFELCDSVVGCKQTRSRRLLQAANVLVKFEMESTNEMELVKAILDPSFSFVLSSRLARETGNPTITANVQLMSQTVIADPPSLQTSAGRDGQAGGEGGGGAVSSICS